MSSSSTQFPTDQRPKSPTPVLEAEIVNDAHNGALTLKKPTREVRREINMLAKDDLANTADLKETSDDDVSDDEVEYEGRKANKFELEAMLITAMKKKFDNLEAGDEKNKLAAEIELKEKEHKEYEVKLSARIAKSEAKMAAMQKEEQELASQKVALEALQDKIALLPEGRDKDQLVASFDSLHADYDARNMKHAAMQARIEAKRAAAAKPPVNVANPNAGAETKRRKKHRRTEASSSGVDAATGSVADEEAKHDKKPRPEKVRKHVRKEDKDSEASRDRREKRKSTTPPGAATFLNLEAFGDDLNVQSVAATLTATTPVPTTATATTDSVTATSTTTATTSTTLTTETAPTIETPTATATEALTTTATATLTTTTTTTTTSSSAVVPGKEAINIFAGFDDANEESLAVDPFAAAPEPKKKKRAVELEWSDNDDNDQNKENDTFAAIFEGAESGALPLKPLTDNTKRPNSSEYAPLPTPPVRAERKLDANSTSSDFTDDNDEEKQLIRRKESAGDDELGLQSEDRRKNNLTGSDDSLILASQTRRAGAALESSNSKNAILTRSDDALLRVSPQDPLLTAIASAAQPSNGRPGSGSPSNSNANVVDKATPLAAVATGGSRLTRRQIREAKRKNAKIQKGLVASTTFGVLMTIAGGLILAGILVPPLSPLAIFALATALVVGGGLLSLGSIAGLFAVEKKQSRLAGTYPYAATLDSGEGLLEVDEVAKLGVVGTSSAVSRALSESRSAERRSMPPQNVEVDLDYESELVNSTLNPAVDNFGEFTPSTPNGNNVNAIVSDKQNLTSSANDGVLTTAIPAVTSDAGAKDNTRDSSVLPKVDERTKLQKMRDAWNNFSLMGKAAAVQLPGRNKGKSANVLRTPSGNPLVF